MSINRRLGSGLDASARPDPRYMGPSLSSVNTSTDVCTAGSSHGLVTGDTVAFGTNGTLPAGITAFTKYYVNVLTSTTFTLHTTLANALAGTSKVDISSSGSGSHIIIPSPFKYTSTNWRKDESDVSAAWIAIGKPALFPLDIKDNGVRLPLALAFAPSDGDSVTYTIVLFGYDAAANSWTMLNDNGETDFSGTKSTTINDPGLYDAIFPCISALSGGTLTIDYDASVAFHK